MPTTSARLGSFALLAAMAAPASAQVIYEDLTIVAPETDASNDRFGDAMALSEDYILIGAPNDVTINVSSGAAYLYDAQTGALLHTLIPEDAPRYAHFGFDVAIDGATLIIGATGDDATAEYAGSVSLYDAHTGLRTARFAPPDIGLFNKFGYAVAIEQDRLVVGDVGDRDLGEGAGSIHVYDTVTLDHLFELHASDASDGAGFGHSVAIHDGLIAVGAPEHKIDGDQHGAVYIFDAATGEERFKLVSDDPRPSLRFGHSVAIGDGFVAVGMPSGDFGPGSVYVFDSATGQQLHRLFPSTSTDDDDGFGWALSVHGRTLLAAAGGAGPRGAVFAFDAPTGREIATLEVAPDTPSGNLGADIALFASRAIASTSYRDENNDRYHFAFIFVPLPCHAADTSEPYSSLDFSDITAFIAGFLAADARADLAPPAGVFDPADVLTFIDVFAKGCP